METHPTMESSYCWGALMTGSDKNCTPCFVSGKGHFKNKVCRACRELVHLPASRTRALSEEQKATFESNSNMRSGFWKPAPEELGGGLFRLMNNTQKCTGPWLVLFLEAPPTGIELGEMPSRWVVDGALPMTVAKGTVVPISELTKPRPCSSELFSATPKRTLSPPKPPCGPCADDPVAQIAFLEAMFVNEANGLDLAHGQTLSTSSSVFSHGGVAPAAEVAPACAGTWPGSPHTTITHRATQA